MSPSLPRQSWVVSANGHADFPLQNLPFGVFRRAGTTEAPRVGVAIGDEILDIPACAAAELFTPFGDEVQQAARACASASLNALMALGGAARRALRDALTTLLASEVNTNVRQIEQYALVSQSAAELFLPVQVGDYTDFYASVHHATNVGSMFRPDNPLLPNYKWVPIGYHGRASSLVVSGTPIMRPSGQRKGPNDAEPTVGPCRLFDYELELGAFVGTGNALGTTIPIAEAESHLWGYCLLNDWSARDIQSWEYQPLGPFLAKNFASTIGAWVVTPEALEPFRAPLAPRAEGDPAPLPYLTDAGDRARGGLALTVEAWLRTPRMREANEPAVRISQGSSLDLYWSFAQMLAHHASGGCNMRPGDLLGSGTISGPARESRGCLLELTWRGAEPLTLPNGETRGFLEAGDELSISAWAEGKGSVRIGFGRCTGQVVG
ncbi:fumarylacetoacetase [Gemmatimonas aurantiaca]|uniref:fumarylacetoacetase n=1 Tax=Gemmatimonas aurantiaca TaxID=173480 RepID=UPI00301D2003